MLVQNVALIMRRKPLAEGITNALKSSSPQLETQIITNYNLAESYLERYKPQICLVEVSETPVYDINYCLNLCGKIRLLVDEGKIILVCPEQDKAAVAAAIKAKREQAIDDFLFYNACLDYIVSKIAAF